MMFTSNPVSKSLLDAVNNIISEKKEDDVTKSEVKKIAKKEVDKAEKAEKGECEVKEEIESIDEAGVLDKLKTGAKKVAGAVNKAIGHGSDEDLRKDLQKKMGAKPHQQHGMKSMAKYNESTSFTFKDRLIERSMSADEKEDREDIVKGMKKNEAYFKKKYGSRWEKVMNATATKNVMKEDLDENQIEEHTTDTLAGRVNGGENNDFKSFKSRLAGRGEPTAPTKVPGGSVGKASIVAHGGAVPSPKIGVAEELVAFIQTEEFDQLDEEQQTRIINFLQQEGWDDMLKAVKAKNEPKPSGDSGVKQGTRYGGGKQKSDKDEDDKKKVSENVEQIDELKKSTLVSYAKKAEVSGKEHSKKSIDAWWNDNDKEKSDKHFSKMSNRMIGVGRAKTKALVAKEEVEQIDELKKSTLASYVKKAVGDSNSNRDNAVYHGSVAHSTARKTGWTSGAKADLSTSKKHWDKVDRRNAGIDKAVDRLAKEEVEQIDELSKETLKSYQDKAMKTPPSKNGNWVSRINGVARSSEKLAKEENEVVEGKDPNMDAGAGAAPDFATDANTSSSPVMNRIKDVTKTAMTRIKTEMTGKK